MKDLTDKEVLSSWFDNPEEFVVQFDPHLVHVRLEGSQVVFTLKISREDYMGFPG